RVEETDPPNLLPRDDRSHSGALEVRGQPEVHSRDALGLRFGDSALALPCSLTAPLEMGRGERGPRLEADLAHRGEPKVQLQLASTPWCLVPGVRRQSEVTVHVALVLVADDDVDLPHPMATRIGDQVTSRVALVGPKPDETFALEKLLKFPSVQVLKAYRREEALHVADLVLRPHFDTERSPVRQPAFLPSDLTRVVFRSRREIGSTV